MKKGEQSSNLQNSNHLPSLVGETGSKTVKLSLRWVPEPESNQHAVSSFETDISKQLNLNIIILDLLIRDCLVFSIIEY